MARSLVLLSLVVAFTCCEAPGAAVHATRQALPVLSPTPDLSGPAGSQLGASVSGCGPGAYIAGAPGENRVYVVRPQQPLTFESLPYDAGPGLLGRLVACDRTLQGPLVLAGTDDGLYFFTSALNRRDFGVVTALDLVPSADAGLVVVGTTVQPSITRARYRIATDSTTASSTVAVSAVAIHPSNGTIAVGSEASSAVKLHQLGSLDSITGLGFQGPTNSGLGHALAWGDVHPNAGLELVATARFSREVFVLGEVNGSLTELMRLGPFSNSAGSGGVPLPVVVEPGSVLNNTQTLQAIWVGVPEANAIYRFVGDAGASLGPGNPISFGWSLSTAGQKLLVGAPSATDNGPNSGGVFVLDVQPELVPGATLARCRVGAPCVTSTCREGTCLGGVLCVPSATQPPLCGVDLCQESVCLEPDAGAPDAGPSDAGEPDAGAPDGGSRDAGTPDAGTPDAGPPDAGARDAGEPDAGEAPDAGPPPKELTFKTAGCSALDAGPLALLALLGARRRRTAQR